MARTFSSKVENFAGNFTLIKIATNFISLENFRKFDFYGKFPRNFFCVEYFYEHFIYMENIYGDFYRICSWKFYFHR